MTEKSFEVNDGDFNFSYEVKGNFIPGEYSLVLSVEEKESDGDILNSGSVSDSIFVKAKATSVIVESAESVKPELNVSFVAKVLDQVDAIMENETLVVKVLNSNGATVFQEEVVSNEEFYYNFESNFPRGGANVVVEYGSLDFVKPIYVEDNKKVSSEVYGNTLKFTNVGNIFYDGIVKFELDSDNFTEEIFVNLSLDIAEIYLHQLEYSGIYNISTGNSFFSGVYLTGAAILVNDKGVDFGGLAITVAFVGLLVFGYVKSRKKTKDDRVKRKAVKKGARKSKVKKPVFEYTEIESDSLIVRQSDSQKVDLGTGNKVGSVKVRDEKMMVRQSDSPTVRQSENPKKRVFMVFVRSESGISEYESIVGNFGFRLNKVDSKMGYVIFYQSNEISPEYKVYNLAKALKRFGDSCGDKLSVVLNRGVFEKKLSILKKFAIFNKAILDMFPGDMVVSNRIMAEIHVKVDKVEKVIEVLGRKIKVWVI
jgi:hypothetical protein